ncbi:hypothetical protein ISG33_08820 [Glaciecola sp. MH2013]|uniref:hypothetical protein n=1 Tax=Glaciecola sp. MH2013 TaxID=2785524 RepID=UPI00189D73A8|nr:hypothetical protein [Glaciecola sp. MH2013]MBF7073495.1 hypothetical protein [Glaciecola sp. MH2013]
MKTIKLTIVSLFITFVAATSAIANETPNQNTTPQAEEKKKDKTPTAPPEDNDIITMLYCKYIVKCL